MKWRRQGYNIAVGDTRHGFIATVNFDPDSGHPCEVFIVGRGKAGHELDDVLYDLGVQISKTMQGGP